MMDKTTRYALLSAGGLGLMAGHLSYSLGAGFPQWLLRIWLWAVPVFGAFSLGGWGGVGLGVRWGWPPAVLMTLAVIGTVSIVFLCFSAIAFFYARFVDNIGVSGALTFFALVFLYVDRDKSFFPKLWQAPLLIRWILIGLPGAMLVRSLWIGGEVGPIPAVLSAIFLGELRIWLRSSPHLRRTAQRVVLPKRWDRWILMVVWIGIVVAVLSIFLAWR